jgi:hypothetical protein
VYRVSTVASNRFWYAYSPSRTTVSGGDVNSTKLTSMRKRL